MTKLLVVVSLLAACYRPSKCDRYAEMEARCGDVGQNERETTRTLAAGMCEAAASPDPAVAHAGARFLQEADCAADAADCDAYKKCRDAVK